MKKQAFALILALVLILGSTFATLSSAEQTPSLNLTLEELSKFNGKDGQPAYVAVDGIIYDVSNSSKWKDGQHNGYEAGQDLTYEIKNISPHGISKLDKVVEVGKLILELTPEELSKFNGKDGQPAYIAVDGLIYDVTALDTWENGRHKGVDAGQDVTAAFAGSPHDNTMLDAAVLVGKLTLGLTLDELAKFNGKDGHPAYIAVNGLIYDVSALDTWENGRHKGVDAGQDVTAAFAGSPHDNTMLAAAVLVGRLVTE